MHLPLLEVDGNSLVPISEQKKIDVGRLFPPLREPDMAVSIIERSGVHGFHKLTQYGFLHSLEGSSVGV